MKDAEGSPPSSGEMGLLTWFPLATQQLRFRSISQVYLYHPTCQGGPSEPGSVEYYLTFHETALSSPFLSTEARRLQDNRVLWPEHNVPQNEGGVKGTIVRIWVKTRDTSLQISVIGIHFSGLLCIGDSLKRNVIQHLKSNSLVFKLHGHYFVCADSLSLKVPLLRFTEMPRTLSYTGKPSYSKTSLAKMQRTLRALKQIHHFNQRLKSDITSRGLDPAIAEVPISTPTPSSSTASLRQLIFNKQTKHPATKKKEIMLTKEIEMLKLKLELLSEEKSQLTARLQVTRNKIETNQSETDNSTDNMTEKFHALSKDKEKLGNWLKTFDEFRGYKEKASGDLVVRRKQLISQLCQIFPLNDPETSLPTIGYVCLPEADNLKERDETEISVALGWTAHLTLMISNLLMVPTRYQINHLGSRSSMVDFVLDKIPEKERTFPLYPKGVERTRFEYAVYLLNKNIAQLRWHCNQETKDLRMTLRNLHGLLSILTTSEELACHHQSPSIRMNLPVAPAVLSGLASSKTFSRGTPPGQVVSILSESEPTQTSSESAETDSEAFNVPAILNHIGGSKKKSTPDISPTSKDHQSSVSSGSSSSSKFSSSDGATSSASSSGMNSLSSAPPCDISEQNVEPKSVIISVVSKGISENFVAENATSKLLVAGGDTDSSEVNAVTAGTSRASLSGSEVPHSIVVENGISCPRGEEGSREATPGILALEEDTPIAVEQHSGSLEQASRLKTENLNKQDAVVGGLAELTASSGTKSMDKVEVGVAADMFWDSVNSRAQVLAVPNSFKTSSKKTFRQF